MQHSGLGESARALPSLTTMRILYEKNGQDNMICKAVDMQGDYVVQTEEVSINVKRIRLYPDKLKELEDRLDSSEPAQYNLNHVVTRG